MGKCIGAIRDPTQYPHMELNTRSLFIIGLPRSLTSLVYGVASSALSLEEPQWTSVGEILNGDRLVTSGNDCQSAPKFTRPDSHFTFSQLCSFFNNVVQDYGYAYKDVVQPWVSAHCLAKRSLAVLRVVRPVHEVASRMHDLGWHYPLNKTEQQLTDSAKQTLALESRLEEALAQSVHLHSVSVNYHDLIYDETVLSHALQTLYPEHDIPPLSYIDEAFIDKRTRLVQASSVV